VVAKPYAALVLVVTGCALSTTPSMDGGMDAFVPDGGTDAGLDAFCDLAPEPAALPAFHADFQLNDATFGASVPATIGGDAVGTWLFDHGTFWVDRDGNAMFNRYASSVDGTAWMVITDADFRLDWRFQTHLEGTVVGPVEQDTVTRAHARWRLDRDQIEPTGLVCESSTQPMFADPGRITFTREDATHLMLLSEVPMASGLVILELHGTLAP
jgi:hypothetical protein